MNSHHKSDEIARSIRIWVTILMYMAIGFLAMVLTLRVMVSFPRRTLSGLSDWLTFGATLMLVLVTVWYAWHTRDMARTSSRAARGEMLLELNELYADERISRAIRVIYALQKGEGAKDSEGSPKPRYSIGEVFYQKYESDPSQTSEEQVLRWQLTNFWYTVATLVKEKVIDATVVTQRFNTSLEVIEILEQIEAVLSYHLGTGAQNVELFSATWPVWGLYEEYKGDPEAKREERREAWARFKVRNPLQVER